jgi:hypothetical protein
MLPAGPSFAANLDSDIFWTSPETSIDECVGDNARTNELLDYTWWEPAPGTQDCDLKLPRKG